MPSGAGDTRRRRAARQRRSGSSSSSSAAFRMKRGAATQWWVQRPSEPLKNPFGARGSKTHELNPSRSACSTRCHVPTVVASAPCSIDVCTCWPRPVISRARSAALIATDRVVERREADPRDATEQRSGSRRTDRVPVRRNASGEDLGVRETPDRRADDASALELLTRARRDERVVRGTVRVLSGLAVPGDRAVDQARVRREQRRVIDPELRGDTRAEALDRRRPHGAPARGTPRDRFDRGGRASRVACRATTPACRRARRTDRPRAARSG